MATKVPQQSMLQKDIAIGGVNFAEKAAFAKHMSVMLQSGLTVVEVIDIAKDSAKGKMKNVLKRVLESVEAGNSLAHSFRQHPRVFSNLFVHVTDAGERSGTLAENLSYISVQLEKEKHLRSKIKGAMTYPAVVLSATVILALAMAYYVLPQITPLFSGLDVELPATTRLVIAFSDIVQTHGTILFWGIIGSIVFLSWFLRQAFVRPVTHWVFLKFPLIKHITTSSNLARFSLTLGTLLKSGLHIDEALRITQATVSNRYYRKALSNVSARVDRGSMMSDILKSYPHLFPKLVVSMVSVGEQSGQLDETLLYVSSFYEDEVDNSTKAFTTALEPLLLITIGVAVATLALAIITPIYEITGNVRR